MLTLRAGSERHHTSSRRQESWRTFAPGGQTDALRPGFGALESLNEYRLRPGTSVPRLHGDAEVVTYVHEGELRTLSAGEFECLTNLRDGPETQNVSRRSWTHVFQLWLRLPEVARVPRLEHKRFSVAQRRGGLRVVASGDGRQGSLLLHQDVNIYSALLAVGQRVVHPLGEGRVAWLHVVSGRGAIDDLKVAAGDGVGLSSERALSLTATDQMEVLLIDLPAALKGADHVAAG